MKLRSSTGKAELSRSIQRWEGSFEVVEADVQGLCHTFESLSVRHFVRDSAMVSEISSGKEERKWLNQVVVSAQKLPDERREKIVAVATEAAKKLPLIADCGGLPPEDLWKLLKLGLPDEDPSDLLTITAFMKLSSLSGMGSSRSSGMGSSATFQSYQDRGSQLISTEVDVNLPHPSNNSRANEIWPKDLWVSSDSPATAMKQMLTGLQYPGCKFDLVEKGSCESVCGKGSKPDMVLKLKGHGTAVYCTGALLCLHSKGSKSRFDNLSSLAEAEDYAMRFLRLAGPSRNFIFVGITDLQQIMWLKFFHERQKTRRSVTTTQVRESLCAFLDTSPDELDVNINSLELCMPVGWRWKTVLGCGKTSVVHEFIYDNESYAVKVPRGSFKLSHDYAFLTMLHFTDGVPIIRHELGGGLLALQPVGVPFTKDHVLQYGLNHMLSQLIDILQAAHAHGIVNRDVRVENFIIASSKGHTRIYIVDWGFAYKAGIRTSFAGCLYTASDNVLQQVREGAEDGVIFESADDLVAVVRCLWLFSCQGMYTQLYELVSGASWKEQAQHLLSFWEVQMSMNVLWKQAHDDAAAGKVDRLKDWFAHVGACL